MKTCYLAGPMRGYPRFNFDAFDAAALDLRERGWGVFSPAEKDIQDGFNPDLDEAKPMKYYMAIDLQEVCKADAVICLPRWEESQGCAIEVFTALSCDMPVLDYPDLNPILPWPAFDAFWTCHEVMKEGARKHKKHSWLFEKPMNHIIKSARHAQTYLLQSEGLSPADGEDHTRMMMCRAAMCVSQKKFNERA